LGRNYAEGGHRPGSGKDSKGEIMTGERRGKGGKKEAVLLRRKGKGACAGADPRRRKKKTFFRRDKKSVKDGREGRKAGI